MAKKKTSKRAHGQAEPALAEGVGGAVECLPGAILWLPPVSEIPFPMGDEIPEGCYNHPVVVLSTEHDPNGNVRVLIVITSQDPRKKRRRVFQLTLIGNLV